MRSARTLLTTAAVSAVLVLGAPGAYAATAGDWEHEDSSYSKEHDNGGKHDEPRGGMHTGGGALTAVNEGDWDGGGSKEGSGTYKQDEGEKSWGGEHEKPRGGMHTGGGGLDTPTTTAGGLAVLAVAGTGLYALRRRKSAGAVA
ncbi:MULTISPECIES: hypothetical protein [Streptomyces]|jgi:hypothetical protein|uniref:LPXTG cell wall anchor domain-containing protein n=3 Tax=Streptomyces rochei group TaxID=2867164 RepID=A0AAX3ZBR6_STRRO|nr:MULTISPECIES: hypothetical protein [Streptomyces]RIH59705.1 hypothetical protein D3C59_24675 [Streptomyces sp. SHP22-7]WDI16635.1 hypothetical protein PS783_03230 [Streptomyces enissocaesilis]KYK13297.1 hypothetical protein AUW26_33150 [Streptomyces sp. CC71]MBJ6618089.1 hypothetical protein [Streptomyces sp. DHE17-7]MBQ0876633.1 hypothetical protein [Streptomyces sp. RT42]